MYFCVADALKCLIALVATHISKEGGDILAQIAARPTFDEASLRAASAKMVACCALPDKTVDISDA